MIKGYQIININRLFKIALLVGYTFLSSIAAFASPNLPDAGAPENSEAIYIVFPDYPINVDKFYGNIDNVGHAGVLLISSSGLTKYYEFGRYSQGGQMRKITVSNVEIDEYGKATLQSLKKVLSQLSAKAGRDGSIRGAYFLNMDFNKMKTNANGANQDYDLISFNCAHFAERVILSGNHNVDQPTIINTTPRNVVDEYIEEGNAEIKFDPSDNSLYVGPHDESDAKE